MIHHQISISAIISMDKREVVQLYRHCLIHRLSERSDRIKNHCTRATLTLKLENRNISKISSENYLTRVVILRRNI